MSSISTSCAPGSSSASARSSLGAVVGFVLHARLITLLEQTLPKRLHGQLVTFSPGEAFMTSLWVSIYFGFVLALPIIFWQVWAFFIPAVDRSHAAADAALRRARLAARLRRSRVRLLPCAPGGGALPHELQREAAPLHPAGKAVPDLLHARAAGDGARVRAAAVRGRARPGSGSSRRGSCARTGGSASSSSAASGLRSPASTRSRRSWRRSRCSSSSRCSIWLSALLDRRSARLKTEAATQT